MQKQNQNENNVIGEKINDFLQKNRKIIYISAGAIVLIIVGCVVTLSLVDMSRSKAISELEELSNRYEALRYSINEEYMEGEVNDLLTELGNFSSRKSGYTGAKASLLIGNIHSEKKEWAEAEESWIRAAEKAAKTHLAPVAWFNAGIAAEQLGKTEKAIDHYAKSLSAVAGFSGASRAQFSIGRLRETLNEKEAAIAAYRAVISGWPYDSVWTSLAHSRIIILELQ